MMQLNESAYESGIFSGIGTLGIGKPPPVAAFRDGSLGTLGKPPPAHAYRDGSLGVLSGVGVGQPPPVHAYRDGSLGAVPDVRQLGAVALSIGALVAFGYYMR